MSGTANEQRRVNTVHHHRPVTLPVATARGGWLLAFAAVCFGMLAVGASVDALPWDGPISRAVFDARTPFWNTVALRVSFIGSTPVIIATSAIAALAAWRRCPRLAVAIVILAVARPLSEFILKELIGRDRPSGDRLVRGRGPAFPSGHPYAVAMAWGLIPMVVALYSRRPWLPRVVAVFAWSAAIAVAASRVWLGVHWTSDAAAGLLVGLLAVCLAERAVAGNGCACPELLPSRESSGLRE
jgi:undecaprenyl-diphosphatase